MTADEPSLPLVPFRPLSAVFARAKASIILAFSSSCGLSRLRWQINGENGRKRPGNLSGAEPLQRRAQSGARLLGLCAALAQFLDHLFRRSGDEVGVAELGVD